MISNDFNPWKNFDNYHEQMFDDKSSDLVQWPVKLWKVPIVSPYFHHAHLLIAADCTAFTYAGYQLWLAVWLGGVNVFTRILLAFPLGLVTAFAVTGLMAWAIRKGAIDELG